MLFSLIIPAYNEKQRIGKSLEQFSRFCNARPAPSSKRTSLGCANSRPSVYFLSKRVFRLCHADAACGFKGTRRDACHELFSRQRLHNRTFEAEVLFIARLKGYRVKVRLWKGAAASFRGRTNDRAKF